MRRPILIADAQEVISSGSISRLTGYAKACSILWLQALSLPVLNGLIIDAWDSEAYSSIRRYAESLNETALLLRIDRKNQRWTDRRGGYLVSVDTVPELWEELSSEDFIPILLEPASPYADLCALTAVLSEDERLLIVEVVGKGFDASDILRSDLVPHERWEIQLVPKDGLLGANAFKRAFLISADAYKTSWNARLAKIGAKILNPSFPTRLVDAKSAGELKESAVNHLTSLRQTALLEASTYEPVSEEMIRRFSNSALLLRNNLYLSRTGIGPFSLAASVLSSGRMVFWDFFPINRDQLPLLWRIAPGTLSTTKMS